MTNDLWQEVQEAYANAAGLPQDERTPYLNEKYAHRPDIRNEVESLLAQKHAAEHLGPSTLFAAAAEVFGGTGGKDDEIIGSIIAGKYLVRECIGAGNMGEVYHPTVVRQGEYVRYQCKYPFYLTAHRDYHVTPDRRSPDSPFGWSKFEESKPDGSYHVVIAKAAADLHYQRFYKSMAWIFIPGELPVRADPDLIGL
jgi:hypothetical protein